MHCECAEKRQSNGKEFVSNNWLWQQQSPIARISLRFSSERWKESLPRDMSYLCQGLQLVLHKHSLDCYFSDCVCRNSESLEYDEIRKILLWTFLSFNVTCKFCTFSMYVNSFCSNKKHFSIITIITCVLKWMFWVHVGMFAYKSFFISLQLKTNFCIHIIKKKKKKL